ncbi:phage holin, LLH family [Ligilactobacillus aviarius]|uniref:phage holin, LLH family n=1 Tax=Ligilactobacillus aviarius TaxID=1606 RepID=UPI0024B93425|nr:phage holin, LLH family [Ligilactobacillus aviarius]
MNNTSIVTQVIIAVAGVLTPAICLYVANLIKKYIPNKSLLQALEQFAKDAVVLAEKAGLTDKLLDKKQYAIDKLQDMLQQAGFSKQDEKLLAGCVERAYCELKKGIESVYKAPEKTNDTKTTTTTPTTQGDVANEEK